MCLFQTFARPDWTKGMDRQAVAAVMGQFFQDGVNVMFKVSIE